MARWEKWGRPWIPSSMKVPSSISRSSRSRAVSLSCSCWRAIFSSPPPSLACSRRSCRSSTSDRREGRATNSSADARSAVDMSPRGDRLEQRLEHFQQQIGGVVPVARILGHLEGGDLESDQLAVLGDGLEKVVQLVGGEA